MGRISIEQLAAAIGQIAAMDLKQKEQRIDAIHVRQPHLLAACLAQSGLGVDLTAVEMLLQLLLVCDQAMQASGAHWPLISEEVQAQQLERTVAQIRFSEEIQDPATSEAARAQLVKQHPEQPLLAYAIHEAQAWLQQRAQHHLDAESDKYVLMCAVNLVNCIAHANVRG